MSSANYAFRNHNKEDLAFSRLQGLICNKTQTTYQKLYIGGARGAMVIVAGYGHGDTSSNLTDCISHSTDTLGKGMNPIILPPAMGK